MFTNTRELKDHGRQLAELRVAVSPRRSTSRPGGRRLRAAPSAGRRRAALPHGAALALRPMCDDDSLDDMLAYRLRAETLSRRGFGVLTVEAGLASVLSAACKASDPRSPFGTRCRRRRPGHDRVRGQHRHPRRYVRRVLRPPRGRRRPGGPHPWPDIFGLRPAFREMGKRLAGSGYAVLVVNPFYRKSPRAHVRAARQHGRPGDAQRAVALAQSLTRGHRRHRRESAQRLARSAARRRQDAEDGRHRILHGRPSRPANDRRDPRSRRRRRYLPRRRPRHRPNPNGPHLSIPKMKAHVLIAIASNDDAKQPDAKDVLKDAFAEGVVSPPRDRGLHYDALHGWCPPDSHTSIAGRRPEKAWGRLLALLKGTPCPWAARRTRARARFALPNHLTSASRSPCSVPSPTHATATRRAAQHRGRRSDHADHRQLPRSVRSERRCAAPDPPKERCRGCRAPRG